MFFFHKCFINVAQVNFANLYTVKNSISFNLANYLYGKFGYSY